MPSELITVARFASTPEAQLAQAALRLEGIEAYLEGDAMVGLVWCLSNAVGGVKLQVAAADMPRAVEVLRRAPEHPPAGHDPRRECDALEPDNEAAVEPVDEPDDEAAEGETPAAPGDAAAARAFRAAVIGLFACPPLLHVYSLWTLMLLGINDEPLSAAGRRHFYLALAIDVVASIVFGMFYAWFVRR